LKGLHKYPPLRPQTSLSQLRINLICINLHLLVPKITSVKFGSIFSSFEITMWKSWSWWHKNTKWHWKITWHL